MYGEDDFDFHREHGITMIDIDQVKDRGIVWTIERVPPCGHRASLHDVRHRRRSPAFAPGNRDAGGRRATNHEAQRLVRGLGTFALVGGDIVEVAPLFDGPGQITALLAANLAFEFLCALRGES